MSRGPDAATLLRRAIEADARRAGCAIEVIACHTKRWASATFVGGQHRLTVLSDDIPALGQWLVALPDADIPLRHHLVADILIVDVARAEGRAAVTIEALTVAT